MQEIEQLIDRLERALGDKDADAVLELFAPENVMMTLDAPLQRVSNDATAGKSGLQSWFNTWDGRITITHRDLVIAAAGDVAYAHMLCHMVGAKSTTGPVDLWYRETYGLRKLDGMWKIAHEHQSVPMAMDGSGKAEVKLKP